MASGESMARVSFRFVRAKVPLAFATVFITKISEPITSPSTQYLTRRSVRRENYRCQVNSFIDCTLEDLFDAIQSKAGKSWGMDFYDRYLNFAKVDKALI